MLVVVFFLFLLYALLLWSLYTGWVKVTDAVPVRDADEYQFISVLVPVRNEEENIGFLIDDIIAQNYPKDSFELLIINDHSQDGTLKSIEERLKSSSFSNITIVHSAKQGKKQAITEGVRLAKGDIILTTDADCRTGRNWLNSFNSYFSGNSVKLVSGPVRMIPGEALFEKMQSIEFSSLIGSGAATLGYRIPSMCNGANLAFRKEVFAELNGYETNFHIASGDDEFLMRKIHQKYPDGIVFNSLKESVVTTQPLPTITGFIAQRLRWAGKWKHHNDLKTKLLASFIFLFHLVVLALVVLTFTGQAEVRFVAVFFAGKAILEYRFLNRVTAWLRIPWSWAGFILLQFTYSLYAVCIALISGFVKPEWKGRIIS